MSEKNNCTLKFENYIVKNVEYKSNLDFTGRDCDLNFDIDSNHCIEGNKLILTLSLTLFDEYDKNDYPFYLKVDIVGLFEINEVDNKIAKNYIESNSVAILFPYLRALVSVYTSNSNIGGTVILPAINVVNYLKSKNKSNKE